MSFKKMQEETQRREERSFLSFLSEKLSKAMEMKGKTEVLEKLLDLGSVCLAKTVFKKI